jgi:hypothetical protein
MGAARLLAKAWVVICVFAGARALVNAIGAGMPPLQASFQVGICTILFGAMGILFVGGYGASSGLSQFVKLRFSRLLPGFDEIVFLAFAALVFLAQLYVPPGNGPGGVLGALEAAIRFALPGQRAYEDQLSGCGLDGGLFFVSAFSWVLALIYLGSALSRIRLAAGIVRLERKQHAEALGPTLLAFILGVAAVFGIQFVFIGTAFRFLPCEVLASLPGQVLIGLGPLMLAYLIVAALTNLIALGPEA